LFKVFNKLKKYLYGNKFELENNFYNRQSFVLRAVSKYNLNTCNEGSAITKEQQQLQVNKC
jgi:hypothetical protein